MQVRTNLCFNNDKKIQQESTIFIKNFLVTKLNESEASSNIILLKQTNFIALKIMNKIKLQFSFLSLNKKINPYLKKF